jgi:ankyrin repeat protein
MHGRKNYNTRFARMIVAILLVAGISQFQPFPPPTVRAGEQREGRPIPSDLATAIRDADAQAVRKLIENGADVNARDAEGNTPLILAAFYASPKCVELLLDKGSDANAANKAGVTALVRAATSYEKTRLLVDAGAKVRVRTADLGNTPLILAARRAGNSRTVKLLLERGADATERNDACVSPIISGAASGDLETVQLLLNAGAKADDFPKSSDPRATDLTAGFQRCADGSALA